MKAENIQDIYELSPAQQGILFHSLYSPESGVYFVQIRFTLHGLLNVVAFDRAWQQVVARHTALRTSFYWEKLDKPLQVVQREVKVSLEQHDWRGIAPVEQQEQLDAFLESDRKQGFDLSQAPLIHLTLIRVADNSYQFVWSQHHLILDGWSTVLVLKEVVELYDGLSQGKDLTLTPSRAYGDYIAWLQQQDLSTAETFWRQALGGIQAPTPLIELDADNLSNQEERYDEQLLNLSAETTATLQSLARQHQLTLNTLVQGAWALLLSRYSGEEDVVYGSTVSGRPAHLVGAELMVGLFINTLPVRVKVDAEQSLLVWLRQLQGQLVEMRQYEYSPLVEIQGWSEVPRGVPLFESIVVFENYPVDRSLLERKANLEIHYVSSFEKTNYPLTLTVLPGSELKFAVSYDRRRFDGATITRMLGHFQTLLQGMVTNPKMSLKDLPLLTETEEHQLLVEWNDTWAEYPRTVCIHQLFEAQVERTPDAVAVVFDNEQLTYQELNSRANQLARYLQKLGVGPEVLVGICVDRSIEMLVGLLGILKGGGAYVPLDPAYPQQRLALMVSDSQMPFLLTQQQLLARLPSHQARVVCLDRDWHTISQESPDNPASSTTPENLAYVIYTSGSTGKPKGVQIPHGGVVNFLTSMQCQPGLTQTDVLLAVTSISFDIAALELYLPLITGARVVLVSREVASDGKQLIEQLTTSGATVMQATPATWQMLLTAGWDGSSQLKILCGGEALPRDLAEQLLARGAAVWNLYGPTETTIWSTVCQVEAAKLVKAKVPVGRPIANTQVYLLDQFGQPVPIGIPGELHIGGAGLARGYLNRPELTEQKFIHHSVAGRLYKTGDLARYLPNGTIEYIERIDHQVKLRGFRIELGEIESLVRQHPAVEQAVVILREDEPGNPRLVAYLVSQSCQDELAQKLRRFVGEHLPSYMVPSLFVKLEALPLTPNGKVDRKALPVPEATTTSPQEAVVLPRNPVEEVLAEIWYQLLGVEAVGIDQNFFELGGHSLLATQVISRIEKAFGVELPVRCLFESPTLAELAASVQKLMQSQSERPVPPIERVSRDGVLPLSFSQYRLWLLDQLQPGSIAYNMATALHLVGSLNVAALEQALNEIVRRHDALRTTFCVVEGQPIQVIAPSLTMKLSVRNLSEVLEAQRGQKVQQLVTQWSQQLFDLTQGPLLRSLLLQLDQQEHLLVLSVHHIVADGWSAGVFFRELTTLYDAFSQGQPSPLPELPIQYADFAVWQRQWLQEEVLEPQLTYWKRQLGTIPPVLKLSSDRSSTSSSTGKKHSFALSSTLTEALKALSQREGVTLFMTLLAAFKTLLYRYSGQEDIAVGSPIANRNRRETEELIGFFVNTLVLRTDLSGNPSFRDVLRQVREVALGAYAHQDLPFEKLVAELQPERNLGHNPLFQVWFVLQNAPMPTVELPGLTLNLLEVETGVARYDLKLDLTETSEGLKGFFEYKTELFEAATIARIATLYETLLDTVIKQPDIQLNELVKVLENIEKQEQLAQEEEFKTARRQKLGHIRRKQVKS
ncbi:amino acid adenylation domain-containing protein [Microcoleus sp. FACHB-53]|nr:amino acid adenylation domain-containing protein [Microcoleus sp. FACHB-53]